MATVRQLKTASTKEIVYRNNRKRIEAIVGNECVKCTFHLDLSEAYDEPIETKEQLINL